MKNNDSKLKELRRLQKEEHTSSVKATVQNVQNASIEKRVAYKRAKMLRWYDLLIVIGVVIVCVGIAMLFGQFVFDKLQKAEWVCAFFSILAMVIWLVVGFVRNRYAAKYYNDARMRYRTTMSETDGTVRRVRWMLFFIAVLNAVASVIIFFTTK